jgi:hypothetical protein
MNPYDVIGPGGTLRFRVAVRSGTASGAGPQEPT